MRRIDALELKNKSRSDAPLVVLVTRRRAPSCDDVGRHLQTACDEAGIELLGVDADDRDPDLALALDELGVVAVPAALVFSRGVRVARAVPARAPAAAPRLLAALGGASRGR